MGLEKTEKKSVEEKKTEPKNIEPRQKKKERVEKPLKGKVGSRRKRTSPLPRRKRKFILKANKNAQERKIGTGSDFTKKDKVKGHTVKEQKVKNKTQSSIEESLPVTAEERKNTGVKDAVTRILSESKSFAQEETSDSEAAPERYAIDQIEGKTKKAGNIVAGEVKRAVKKALKKNKTEEKIAVPGTPQEKPEAEIKSEAEEISEKPEQALEKNESIKNTERLETNTKTEKEEKVSPIADGRGTQTQIDNTADAPEEPKIGTGSDFEENKTGLEAPLNTYERENYALNALENDEITTQTEDISAVNISLKSYQDEEKTALKDSTADAPEEPEIGTGSDFEGNKTGLEAPLNTYERENYALNTLENDEITTQSEDISAANISLKSYQNEEKNAQTVQKTVLPRSYDSDWNPVNTNSKPEIVNSENAEYLDDNIDTEENTYVPAENKIDKSKLKASEESFGKENPELAYEQSYSDTEKALEIKMESRELNINDNLELNTWQSSAAVNGLNNAAPNIANAVNNGGNAIQAATNYGEAIAQQTANAAGGAATGGTGYIVQAAKKLAEKVKEQITEIIKNATVRSESSTNISWGIGAIILFAPFIIIFAVVGLSNDTSSGSASNIGLSDEVIALMPLIEEACEENAISEYAPLVAAVMMQESGGNTELVNGDVMQCAEGMGYAAGTAVNVEESIKFGTSLLANYLRTAGATGPTDINNISLALQGYNFGGGYITWAKYYYGGYSKENAVIFSEKQAAALGWSGYGDTEYVEHVLRYYSVSNGQLGDESAIANGLFSYPMPGHTWFTYSGHEGIDISYSGITGAPVYACADGTVSYVQNSWTSAMGTSGVASYGNCVFIDHGDGWETRYAHMSTVVVSEGETVTAGQLLGYVGNTGNSTGPHLHLAIYYNSNPWSGSSTYAALAWPEYKD